MSHTDEIHRTLGHLQATISVGFWEVHRRMDDRDRFTAERHRETTSQIRYLTRRLDARKSNGGGIPFAKIAVFLGLIILGTLGSLFPEATRAGIVKAIPSIVKELLAAVG